MAFATFTPFQVNSLGGVGTPPTAVPPTIAGSGTYVTGILPAGGYNKLAIGCTLSQNGSISVQQYINLAGTLAIGSAVTQALTANTFGTVAINDGMPCATWIVTITNSSGSTANLTDFSLLVAQ